MPDDPAVAVAVLLEGAGGAWTRDDLTRMRALISAEYHGPDRTEALATLDRLLGA